MDIIFVGYIFGGYFVIFLVKARLYFLSVLFLELIFLWLYYYKRYISPAHMH